MKRTIGLVFIFMLCSAGCHRHQSETKQVLPEIAGCWNGRRLSPVEQPFSVLRLFSLRPDSSLAVSLVFESGPRSRVWVVDSDVEVADGFVRWEDCEGSLSRGRDSMTVTMTAEGGASRWLLVRDRANDSLMMRLRASTAGPYAYTIPQERDDDWSCGDIGSAGIDRGRITSFIEEILDGEHDDIHSLLIVKGGRLVVEEYFADNGRKHGPFIADLFREKPHHLASTTKAVTSTLVGIAIDHGFISSVEDPIYRYLPAYQPLFSEGKRKIRIRDMLTMTPGFEWRQFGVRDESNDGIQMWNTKDVIRFVLEKPLEAEPGEKFNYTNGVPTVTGAILKNAVGMDVRQFAEQYLFRPLGIRDYVWTSYPDGSIETDGGLALRSRDLAKIGQLFLDYGVWKDSRIVSEQWIAESTKERLRFGMVNRWGYGYHWMQAESWIGDRRVRSYFVPGDGNQIVAVFPELTLVVVVTAGNYGKDPKKVYYSLFDDIILPATLSGER